MRVLIATGIFPPDIGGPATHAADLAEELEVRGHEVSVLTCTDGRRVEHHGAVHRYPRRWPWPIRHLALVAWIVRQRRRYDAVYATGLGPAAVAGARLARRPVVLKVVGDPAWERGSRHQLTSASFDDFQEEPGGTPRLRLMRRLRNWTVRSATTLVAPSASLRDVVERWAGWPGVVQIIPNGARRAEARGVRHRTDGALHVVFVGRLVAHKRVEVILEAVATAGRVTLDVIGDGPELDSLVTKARALGLEGRVTFKGVLDRATTAMEVATADALVLASSYEGLPHVVVEALVSGTPVVTSPVPGTLEVVRHEHNGLVVDPPTPEALAATLGRLRDDPDLRARLSAGAASSAEAWSFGRTADRIEALLAALVTRLADGEGDRRPRTVFLGRSRLRVPVPDDLRPKLAMHARYLEAYSITPGPVGVRRVERTTAIALPDCRPRPATSALFYTLGPAIAVALAARRRPGAIVCQSPYEAVGVIVASRCLPRGTRPAIQVEVHGDWRTAARLYGHPLRWLLGPGSDRVAAWALRRADRVRVVSELLADLVRDAGYHGPVERHIAFSDYRSFLEAPLVPLPDGPVATFVGMLEPYKAVDVLLDAWAALLLRLPEARLRIVGAGSRSDLLQRRARELGIQDKVEFVGAVPRGEVIHEIDRGTALVLPSRSEGLPRIVVEAMARARPVVATTVGGMAELVNDGRSGRLVQPEDVLALTNALCEVLIDRDRAAAMGQEGRRRVLERDPLVEYEHGIRGLAEWLAAR
jgi:glycosyltransferase involved in cell wall biosynthesis